MLFKKPTFHGDEPASAALTEGAELEALVADRLASIGSIDASDLTVVLDRGTIILTGTMATQGEIDRTIDAVTTMPGVSTIDARISLRDQQ